MNLPTSVVITGCESPAILQQALEAAVSFKAMGKDEVAQLPARTASAAGTESSNSTRRLKISKEPTNTRSG
jgi:hypothetical protein